MGVCTLGATEVTEPQSIARFRRECPAAGRAWRGSGQAHAHDRLEQQLVLGGKRLDASVTARIQRDDRLACRYDGLRA